MPGEKLSPCWNTNCLRLFISRYNDFKMVSLIISQYLLSASYILCIRKNKTKYWVAQSIVTPWTATHRASLSSTSSQSLLKQMSIELVMPSNHLILRCPLLFLPSIFPSIRVFSNELALPIRWPKYWIFSFSISPSNEYSGLISFQIDWLDFLAVQGTLKSFL